MIQVNPALKEAMRDKISEENRIAYDAIVASDDLIAAGALKALIKAGKRVPKMYRCSAITIPRFPAVQLLNYLLWIIK